MNDGERRTVPGSGTKSYTVERKGEIYSCSCQAWRFQKVRIEERTCKHLKRLLGEAVEVARVAAARNPQPKKAKVARTRGRGVEDTEGRIYDIIK